jgi:hypothetical protein
MFVATKCLEKDNLILYCGWNMGFDKITLGSDGKVSERNLFFIGVVDEADIHNRPL